MGKPLISCIMPVYNGEKYLAEALESIFAQTIVPEEIIVADDCSQDGTAAVLEKYRERITVIRLEKNLGPPSARNSAIRASRGEFLTFLDADDLWHPEKTEIQLTRFREVPSLSMCQSYAKNFWSPELTEDERGSRHPRLLQPWPGNILQSMMIRRVAFDKVGWLDPALLTNDDGDWFLRAKDTGIEREMLTDVLVHRRLHLHNLTRIYADDSRESLLKRVKELVDRQRDNKR